MAQTASILRGVPEQSLSVKMKDCVRASKPPLCEIASQIRWGGMVELERIVWVRENAADRISG